MTPRLLAIANFVSPKAVLADIGTDHAYLPITLANDGKILCAVASDVNSGPIERAKANVLEHQLEKTIFVQKADGLQGIEAYQPTDIVIAGMGGDLIAQIIERAPWVHSMQYHLILQPMTKAHHLRKYLWENGFLIENETFAKEESRVYQILSCRFCGQNTSYTELDAYLGKALSQTPDSVQITFLQSILMLFEKRFAGLLLAESDSQKEKDWLQSAIFTIKEQIKRGNEV